MGGEFLATPPPKTFLEWLDENCAYHMSIGMTHEQFWHDDPLIAVHYRNAEKLRNEKRNQELWLQGMYIYQALCDVSPVLNAFAKKGTKPTPYIEKPFPLTLKQAHEQSEQRKTRQYQEKQQSIERLAASINAKKRSERKSDD